MTKTGLLALTITLAASAAVAQDPEAGDIDVNLPPRKVEAPAEPSGPRFTGTPGPLRLYGGFSIALGGDYKDNAYERTFTMDPTVGLQGGADYVMMDYFSIGGEMRFLFWKRDGEPERNFFWDIDVKPRGRYAFSNMPLEVYGAMPVGLTIPGLHDEGEGKIGWNVGVVAGANYFFKQNMGVNVEMGWVFHKFKYGTEGLDGTSKGRFSQFLLLCPNFIYVL